MTWRGIPWWLYMVAASLCGYFALKLYTDFTGPERVAVGIDRDYAGSRIVLRHILPNSPEARAGLQQGDCIIAVDGQPIHSKPDWWAIAANFEVGTPRRLEIEREGERFDLVLTLGQRHWSQQARPDLLISVLEYARTGVCLLLAFVVAFGRPRDAAALLGAWILAAWGGEGPPGYGFAAAWRHLPTPVGALLWIAFLVQAMGPPAAFTFFAIFPRKLFRSPWPLRLAWTVGLAVTPPGILHEFRMVYRPEHATGMSQAVLTALIIATNLFLLGGLAELVTNYRRLDDLNERRRVRVLVLGNLVGFLGFAPVPIAELVPGFAPRFFSTPAPILSYFLSLLIPFSFAYALLRHRLFDIRIILRQGLQYALARGIVLSAVPVVAVILLVDLWLHGDQPLVAILHTRGWTYASLAGLALLAFTQRRNWLETLDRRFFRERYDAQRLLREVVQEIRVARDFEQEAPRVVARVESALHPEFAALLVREAQEESFRALATAPAGYELAALPAESKLMALMRVLGKPLEMPHSDSGWLRQKLPREESEFLRRARIDLLVPVETSGEHGEAFLVLGTKRSEEPYSREDQDLLAAIAASLAILLEKPTVEAVPRRDLFQECPNCGACYDTSVSRCIRDSMALVPVALPRLLGGRYRLDRRLGRGGMGTVYEASDTTLERCVAVKVIRDDLLGSAEAAERFRREARAAAAFTHPNVVTVYDFGLTTANRAFLVMELLRGVTLRGELRKETRLTAPRALAILRDVCAAIEAAHERDLVHRDLKPENIFLARSNSHEIAKVLDFGVAKFVHSPAQEATVDTDTGMLLGTLRYMSPEQLRNELPSPVWDLWALGVVAYEMLTGGPPFAGESSVELLRAIVAGRAIPVAVALPDAPTGWQRFFDRALACDAALRPRSPATFLVELQSALA